MKKAENNSGFSLVELIIVVVIMGALATILLTQYIKYVDKSREAVCSENMAQARTGYMLDEMEHEESHESSMDHSITSLGGAVEESGKSYTGLCPAGGVTYVSFDKNGTVVLSCSKHTKNRAPVMGDPTNAFVNAFGSSGLKLNLGQRLDSTAEKGDMTAELKKALSEGGVSLTDFNIACWAIANSSATGATAGSGGGMLYLWSSFDVTQYKNGEQIPVMCYNADTNSYTVGMTNVTTNKSGNRIIGQSCEVKGFGVATENKSQNFTSYDEALKAYETMSAEMK